MCHRATTSLPTISGCSQPLTFKIVIDKKTLVQLLIPVPADACEISLRVVRVELGEPEFQSSASTQPRRQKMPFVAPQGTPTMLPTHYVGPPPQPGWDGVFSQTMIHLCCELATSVNGSGGLLSQLIVYLWEEVTYGS